MQIYDIVTFYVFFICFYFPRSAQIWDDFTKVTLFSWLDYYDHLFKMRRYS